MTTLNRAKRRRKARKLMKDIMNDELSAENVNMSRRERRKEAWDRALKIVRSGDSDYSGINS